MESTSSSSSSSSSPICNSLSYYVLQQTDISSEISIAKITVIDKFSSPFQRILSGQHGEHGVVARKRKVLLAL